MCIIICIIWNIIYYCRYNLFINNRKLNALNMKSNVLSVMKTRITTYPLIASELSGPSLLQPSRVIPCVDNARTRICKRNQAKTRTEQNSSAPHRREGESEWSHSACIAYNTHTPAHIPIRACTCACTRAKDARLQSFAPAHRVVVQSRRTNRGLV